MLRSEPVRPVARFRIDAPAGAVWFGWPRIAPDGSRILFQAVDTTGTMRAYVRPTDQLDGVAIPGSEGLTRAYWSPDGKEVIFVQNGNLMSASLAGGSPRLICAAKGGTDLSWGSKGTILMDGQYVDSLRAVPSTGGEPKYATRVDHAKGEVGTAWPSFLPDGEHFLFIGNMPQGMVHNHMRLGELGSLESKYLGDADGRVEYAPGDWVIFSRSTSLFAQKLDVGAGKLTGEPITLTDQLSIGGGQGEFSVSPQGSIVFKRLQSNDAQTIAIMDRSGHVQQNPSLMATFYNPQISPDGKRLLYQRLTSGGNASEIDVFDLVRSTDTKLTFTNGTAVTPQWSPDGRRFAFITRTADGTMKLRTGASDGLGAMDSMTLPPRSRAVLTQWAAAGSRFIVTVSGGILSATAGDTAHALTALGDSTKGFLGQVSPDGRWLVFVSGNPPSSHVYVRSLIGPPGRWQISSTVQGYKPHWTRGGRELIYEDWNGVLQSVTIDTQEGFRAGTPQRLFKLPLPSGNDDQVTWTVDDAGEHFYVIQAGDGNHLGSVEVITDIGALLKRK
jgi:Tol biopolymer transport system component